MITNPFKNFIFTSLLLLGAVINYWSKIIFALVKCKGKFVYVGLITINVPFGQAFVKVVIGCFRVPCLSNIKKGRLFFPSL
jgi:hypothetical protein